MRQDCGDLRFTDSDGKTLLNYWIQSGCNTLSTTIWVKIPNIPPGLSETIYAYYGNPHATTQSSPSNVFVFYDNFPSGDNQWNGGTIKSGTLLIGSGASSSCATVTFPSLVSPGDVSASVDWAFGPANAPSEAGNIYLVATNGSYVEIRPHMLYQKLFTGSGSNINSPASADWGQPYLSWYYATNQYYRLAFWWSGSNWALGVNNSDAGGLMSPGPYPYNQLKLCIDSVSYTHLDAADE